MKNLVLILSIFFLSGCTIQKFNQPPMWSSAVISHERFFGINASIPAGSGTTIGVKLGWGSVVWGVIPCSTNKVYSAPISDTFSLGQSIDPFDTQINEDLQAGWAGDSPSSRYPKLFGSTTNSCITANISTNTPSKKLVSPKEK